MLHCLVLGPLVSGKAVPLAAEGIGVCEGGMGGHAMWCGVVWCDVVVVMWCVWCGEVRAVWYGVYKWCDVIDVILCDVIFMA